MTIQANKKVDKNEEGGNQITHAREGMTNKAINELYLLEVISKDQESAARTLYRSCLQAYQRTRDKTKPWYNKVEFQFESPLNMVIQFITNLPYEWDKWQDQQIVFDSNNKDSNYNFRPSLDRINSEAHYSIDNIQTDSIKGNYTDASNRRRKKTALIEIENGQLGFKVYDSQTELKNDLNIQYNKFNTMKKRPYDLNVIMDDGKVIPTGKQVIAMEYIQLPPRPKEEQDRLDKQSYTNLLERINLLKGFSFDEKRAEHIAKLKENLTLYKKFGWDKL